MPMRIARFAMVALVAAIGSIALIAGGPAAADDLDIEASARRVIPHIEAVTGLKYVTPVPVEWVDRERLQSILMEERAYELKVTGKQDDPMDRVQAEYHAIRDSRIILGKYSLVHRRVYFVRQNVLETVPSMKMSDNWQVEVIDALAAHELTHALDDQHFNLSETVLRVERTEEMLALRALEEGHAIFVSSQVCRRLDYPDHSTQMALIHDPGDPNDLRTAGSYSRESLFYFQYAKGSEFVAQLYRRGGPELVRQAFAQPPRYASQIFKPELYLNRLPPVPDLEAILAPADRIPAEGLTKNDFSANEILLRMGFQRIGAEKTEDAASGFVTGRSRDFLKPGSEQKALITVFYFVDDAGARRFFTGEEDLMLAQWDDIAARIGSDFKKVRRLELPLGDGCVWSQASYKSVKGEPIDDQQVFVQVGPIVFEVAVFNMNMTDDAIRSLLNELVESARKALEPLK